MIIRPAMPDDAPACAAILGAFFEQTPWLPRLHTEDEDRAFLAHLIETAEVTVACDRDVQGYIACSGDEVEHLYLAQHAQRQGIGRRLMDHAKTDRQQLTLWCFQQNAPALAFYRAQGFVETQRTDDAGNEEGLPDVHLTWRAA